MPWKCLRLGRGPGRVRSTWLLSARGAAREQAAWVGSRKLEARNLEARVSDPGCATLSQPKEAP